MSREKNQGKNQGKKPKYGSFLLIRSGVNKAGIFNREVETIAGRLLAPGAGHQPLLRTYDLLFDKIITRNEKRFLIFDNSKVLGYYYQFSNRWLKPMVVRFAKSEVTEMSPFVVDGAFLYFHDIHESLPIGVCIVAGMPHAVFTILLFHSKGGLS